MNKLATVAAFALLALPFAAQAAETPAAAAPAPVAAPVAAPVKADMKAEVKAEAKAEAKEVTLKDGTKVEIEGDMVSVVGADGAKKAAPDGTHELADGTKITVKAGKLVK